MCTIPMPSNFPCFTRCVGWPGMVVGILQIRVLPSDMPKRCEKEEEEEEEEVHVK